MIKESLKSRVGKTAAGWEGEYGDKYKTPLKLWNVIFTENMNWVSLRTGTKRKREDEYVIFDTGQV